MFLIWFSSAWVLMVVVLNEMFRWCSGLILLMSLEWSELRVLVILRLLNEVRLVDNCMMSVESLVVFFLLVFRLVNRLLKVLVASRVFCLVSLMFVDDVVVKFLIVFDVCLNICLILELDFSRLEVVFIDWLMVV